MGEMCELFHIPLVSANRRQWSQLPRFGALSRIANSGPAYQ